MNPLALLGWWRELLIAALVVAIGVQTFRLQGTTADRDKLATEKTERLRRDAMRDAQALRNKERTDEDHAAARGRAGAVLVRGEPAGTGIKPPAGVALAERADSPGLACYDRGALELELAGWMARHAARLEAAAAAVTRGGDDRFTTIARAGETLAADARACRAWGLSLARE